VHDLIVLGGGPAGLAATVYAIRRQLNVLLISPNLGGKVGWHLHLPDHSERFQAITGEQIVSHFKDHIEQEKPIHRLEHGEKVEPIPGGFSIRTREGHQYETRTLVVATGTTFVKLNVRGADRYRGHGLAYGAAAFAPLSIGRTAAIVGEGEMGLLGALELAGVARQVYLIISSSGALDSALGRKIRSLENITVLEGYTVSQIKGDDTYARSIVVVRGTEEKELAVDMTLVELGLIPNSEPVAGLVRLNEKKYIMVDGRSHTSCPGIFAAGDVTDIRAGHALICLGEGAKAALSAYEYLLTNQAG